MVSVEVKDKDLDYISKEAKHITAELLLSKTLSSAFHTTTGNWVGIEVRRISDE